MDDLATIEWCKKKKTGIRLITPNDTLFYEYVQTAQETFNVLRSIRGKSKVWLATTKYYCQYFALYALLMKIGIKSEIHDCTIVICAELEQMRIIPKGYVFNLEQDKQLRIDNQYYLKNKKVFVDYDTLLEFILNIKDIGLKLTSQKIKEVRNYLKN